MSEEDEILEQIKRQKLLEMRKRLEEEARKAQLEAQKQAALRVILTPEARQRLTNIKLVRPELAEALEAQLIQAAQTGQIKLPISDHDLKRILLRLESNRRREIRIRRI